MKFTSQPPTVKNLATWISWRNKLYLLGFSVSPHVMLPMPFLLPIFPILSFLPYTFFPSHFLLPPTFFSPPPKISVFILIFLHSTIFLQNLILYGFHSNVLFFNFVKDKLYFYFFYYLIFFYLLIKTQRVDQDLSSTDWLKILHFYLISSLKKMYYFLFSYKYILICGLFFVYIVHILMYF